MLLEKTAQWGRKLRRVFTFSAFMRLVFEIRAHIPILPVLSKQLRDASDDLAHEVENICVQFQEMSSGAKESVKLVSGLLGNTKDERNVNQIIQDCRATMSDLLSRIDQGHALHTRAIDHMETVNASVQQVFKVLQEVDKTSFANKLVGLNAKIEAVHLGHLGSGFEVVAEQISLQAAKTNELTSQVGTILENMMRTMQASTDELKRLAELDSKQMEASRRGVEEALESLQLASSEMQSGLAKAGDTAERLADGISKAVISLQFQDRVTQRIGHVVDSLNSMSEALSERKYCDGNADLERRKHEVSRALTSSYTMDSERTVHGAGIVHSSQTSEGGDVELF